MDRRPSEAKSSSPPCKKEAERATAEQDEQRTDVCEESHDDDGVTATATTILTSAATPDLEAGSEAQEGSGGGETDAPRQDNKDQLATFKLQRIENAAEAEAAVPSSPGSSPVRVGHQDDGNVEEMSPVARRTSRPGAVAVPGPFLPTRFAGADDDDEEEESPSPPVRPPRIGRLERDGSATTATSSSLLLSEPVAAAYAVQDSESDTDDDETHSSSHHHHHNHSSRSLRREKLEKIRSEILAAAAEAVMVTPPPEQSVGGDSGARKLSARRLQRRRRTLVISIVGAAVVVAAVVAVALGVAVSKLPHGRDPPPAPTSAPGSDVVASVAYSAAPEGAFAESIRAEVRGGSLFNVAAMASSGIMEFINCVVKPCTADGNGTALCVPNRVYVPGCCLGDSCPNETQCGDVCPPPPDSCYLTRPDNVTCTHAECYTCQSDLYELSNFAITVDCLHAGTAVRKSNGQTYKWAIACGPVEQGGRPDRDQADGEYQCAAARMGAGYPGGTEGGALTDPVSCRYLALAECGCGPPDMNSLDLPPPTEACPVNGTACPFRCDPGSTDARLCRAFPDNVTWWEGTNSLDRNWFSTSVVNAAAPSDGSLRIYLKDGSP